MHKFMAYALMGMRQFVSGLNAGLRTSLLSVASLGFHTLAVQWSNINPNTYIHHFNVEHPSSSMEMHRLSSKGRERTRSKQKWLLVPTREDEREREHSERRGTENYGWFPKIQIINCSCFIHRETTIHVF